MGTAPAARAGGLGPGGWAAASRACLMAKSLSTNHSFCPTAPRPRRASPEVTSGHARAGRGVEGPKLRFMDKVLSIPWDRTPAGVPPVGITPGRRRSGRLPWGGGRHVGASFDAQKQPGVRCHVHPRGGPCDWWLSPPNYEEGLGRCPSAGVRRRGCWLSRNPQVQRLLPGVGRKIGGFARPTCRKFGGDLPRHRRDVLRLRCEGMGLRATSERRDLVSAAEQAGGARCEATASGGRGVRTASAVAVAISFVPLPLRPPPRPPIPARHPHTHFAGTRAVSLGGHRSGGLGGTSDGRARLRLGVLFWGVLAAPRTAHRRRRWGKLTRNSRSVVVTTAIPMENLTRPCIADSRGAVFERRQPIL